MHDVIIIGGGPAGLSAALILGRCRRSVLLVDGGEPRNGASRSLHGYLTRDGVSPQDLRAFGRRDLAAYPTVDCRAGHVEDARAGDGGGFSIKVRNGGEEHCRVLLLATGRVDPLPDLPGFREFYGRGVHHCPYCDGWEHRDHALAVFGNGPGALALAAELFTWTDRVTLCTHGTPRWTPAEVVNELSRHPEVPIVTERIRGLEGTQAGLNRICFESGSSLPTDGLFFVTECAQRSPLPENLGCRLNDDNAVICEGFAAAGVPGLYLAGNVRGGLHLAITAAAEGAEAAVAINEALG